MSVPYSARANTGTDGIATVTLGPTRAGEKWSVINMTVQSASVTLQPIAKVYRSVVNASALVDGTLTGVFDVSTLNPPIGLGSGENLICQWTGGDVGSLCVFTMDVESVRK